MDTDTAIAFANEAARLNIIYVLFALALLVSAAGLIFWLGERALGFNTKRFLNHVEDLAKRAATGHENGSVWPGVVLLISVQCLFGLVLYIGLR